MSGSEGEDNIVSDDEINNMLFGESEEEENSLSFEEAAKKKAKEEAEEKYKNSVVAKSTAVFFEEERAKKQAEEEAKKQAEAEGLNPFNRRQTDNDYWSDIDLSIFDSNEDDNVLYGSDNSITLINDNNDEDMGKQKNLLENEKKTRNSDDNDNKKKNTFDRSKQFDQYRKDTINEAKKIFFEKSKKKIGKTNFINLEKNRQFLYPKVSGIPISRIFQITKKNMKLQLAKYKRRAAGTGEQDLAKREKNIQTWKTWRKSNNVEGWKNVLIGLLKDATYVEQEIIYETLICFLVKDDPDEAIDYAAKMTNQENRLNINKKEYIYKDEYQKVHQRNTKALRNKYNKQSSLKKQKLKLQECMSNLKF